MLSDQTFIRPDLLFFDYTLFRSGENLDYSRVLQFRNMHDSWAPAWELSSVELDDPLHKAELNKLDAFGLPFTRALVLPSVPTAESVRNFRKCMLYCRAAYIPLVSPLYRTNGDSKDFSRHTAKQVVEAFFDSLSNPHPHSFEIFLTKP